MVYLKQEHEPDGHGVMCNMRLLFAFSMLKKKGHTHASQMPFSASVMSAVSPDVVINVLYDLRFACYIIDSILPW